MKKISSDIESYNRALSKEDKEIGTLLATEITQTIPHAENKIWHGHPVWFLEGNPIVGYSKLKDSIQVLFWSGQSFDEPLLENEGKYKAAQIRYTSTDQINTKDLKRLLTKAVEIQWDYKNIVKRKGELVRLS